MRFYCMYTHGKRIQMNKNKALLNVSNMNLLILDVSTRRLSSAVHEEWEYKSVIIGN